MAARGSTPPAPPNRRWRAEPTMTSVLPTLIPVEARGRRGGCGEILPPSRWQQLSLTSPSREGSECASEKNRKTFGNREELSSPVCAKFQNFLTRSRPAVSAPALSPPRWQPSRPRDGDGGGRRPPGPRRGGAGRCENRGGALGEQIFTAP